MPATLPDYRRMIADRPPKFSEKDVNYLPAARNGSDYHCSECLHFYKGLAARRTVCEILRRQLDQDIEPAARCDFWTRTGERFPLLKVA